MDLSREFLFFFSLLGVFNGLILSLYFGFLAKPRHISNYFLAAFLLSLSIRIGKSVFFYFYHDLAHFYLQLGLSSCLFIGPFLYCYYASIFAPSHQIHRRWRYHIVLLLLAVLYVGIRYPFATYIELWRPGIIHGIYYVWLGYSLAAGYVIRDVLKQLFLSPQKLTSRELWVVSLFFGNLAIWAAYYFVGITSYILGALLFSFMLYLLVLLLIINAKQGTVIFSAETGPKGNQLSDTASAELVGRLHQYMEASKSYKNPNLKLADVARQLKVPAHFISQVLNSEAGYGFPHLLNTYRIEEAKRLLSEEQHTTLEALGYDSGFNSKSTFFATFKKFTGTTPARYRENANVQPKN